MYSSLQEGTGLFSSLNTAETSVLVCCELMNDAGMLDATSAVTCKGTRSHSRSLCFVCMYCIGIEQAKMLHAQSAVESWLVESLPLNGLIIACAAEVFVASVTEGSLLWC